MCFKKKSLSAYNEESTALQQTPKYTESLKKGTVSLKKSQIWYYKAKSKYITYS